MRIYLASSWKNEKIVKEWSKFLKNHCHEVNTLCDNLTGRYIFNFSDIHGIECFDQIDVLQNDKVKKAFAEDKKWLDWADVCLLILPAGKSAHLEAGYSKGCGKKLIIWQSHFTKGEFDVMYGFADIVTDSTAAVLDFLEVIK
jgi:hypothetical protein